MPGSYLKEHSSDWTISRRNLVALCGILTSSLLANCNGETHSLNQDDDHQPNCYVKGTRVLTTRGERPIQELTIGDLVITSAGVAKPIKWIARRLYVQAAHKPWPKGINPVRISRSALQADIPQDDLLLSQNHCLYLDGMLIRAGNLVNGSSIMIDNGFNEIEYLHIVLDKHDIILAEGVTCETLLVNQTAQLFDNSVDYEQHYGTTESVAQQPYAIMYADFGRRKKVYSHLRSAVSPLIDRRTTFDKLRDRLIRRSDSCPVTLRRRTPLYQALL
jgi:hypothetical protein